MMAGFAAIAMGALFAMRYERNTFAEATGAAQAACRRGPSSKLIAIHDTRSYFSTGT